MKNFWVIKPRVSIIPVNQVHDNFHHHVLFFGTAFGNQERDGDERIVRNAFASVYVV